MFGGYLVTGALLRDRRVIYRKTCSQKTSSSQKIKSLSIRPQTLYIFSLMLKFLTDFGNPAMPEFPFSIHAAFLCTGFDTSSGCGTRLGQQ